MPRGNGLYLFDEPEAALSPMRQTAALATIHRLVERGSQFIIATHSPILLAYPRSRIVQFDGTGLSEVQYEDTEHFSVTRYFLNHYKEMVQTLMTDEETIARWLYPVSGEFQLNINFYLTLILHSARTR